MIASREGMGEQEAAKARRRGKGMARGELFFFFFRFFPYLFVRPHCGRCRPFQSYRIPHLAPLREWTHLDDKTEDEEQKYV